MSAEPLLSLLAWLLLAACAWSQDVIGGRTVAVTDGDTIKVLTAENQLLRVRVAWIDAPEMGQAFGRRAKQAMSELVFGKEVELRTNGLDRYGRTLAVVFVDGTDAGLELIKEGFAWAYTKYPPEASVETQQSPPPDRLSIAEKEIVAAIDQLHFYVELLLSALIKSTSLRTYSGTSNFT
jgi:endonuclease YncB( thermonuclease family)